ncbi:MAG: prepilin-type N-terminal cleavage/methylation domain-containing protein [Chthonomonadales bacterium]|nr:prepilin-type N-terminal cleavage/methylation domain-containing protein [Chthonomonadales bacterium]
MKTKRRRRQSLRGFTFVELMVAAVLLGIGLMAVVGLWRFSFEVSVQTDDMGAAYLLGRRAMEAVKMTGFADTAEGAATLYYSGAQAQVAQGSGSERYRVITQVVSDAVSSGTAGVAGAVPADGALRTVTISVALVSSGETLYQTRTHLARAGV